MPSTRITTARKVLLTLIALAIGAWTTAASSDQSMLELATARGCFVCHSLTVAEGGTAPLAPSYTAIATRYKERKDALDYLVDRIRNGTVYKDQNWSDQINMRFMPPNVNVSASEARELTTWILSLGPAEPAQQTLRHETMLVLATNSGCMTCHDTKRTANSRYVPLAPSFEDVAKRYTDDGRYEAQLVDSVLHGTMNKGKTWADVNMRFMPPSVALRPEDAQALVSWILGMH